MHGVVIKFIEANEQVLEYRPRVSSVLLECNLRHNFVARTNICAITYNVNYVGHDIYIIRFIRSVILRRHLIYVCTYICEKNIYS